MSSLFEQVLVAYALTTLSPILPLVAYTVTRRRRRTHWVTLVSRESDYRADAAPAPHATAPPTLAQITALLSWWLGQLAVPMVYILRQSGLLNLRVLAVPALVIAVSQLAVGSGILQGNIDVLPRARTLARRASAVGAIVGIVAVAFALGVLAMALFTGGSLASLLPFAYLGALVYYAAITVLYGELLLRSAHIVEANGTLRVPCVERRALTP
ncbi:MAG: hypothetical protein Q8Q09_16960 [Deltaproteobacteria bacterium]|nr:hypothetical protein [Deltaproteobacteria bacterium]